MYGKKLELKKDFKGIIEVVGLYPAGQGGLTETHYEVSIAGARMRLPGSLIDILFDVYTPPVITELAQIKPMAVAKEVIKEEKKKKK